jgi:hypothetical protein
MTLVSRIRACFAGPDWVQLPDASNPSFSLQAENTPVTVELVIYNDTELLVRATQAGVVRTIEIDSVQCTDTQCPDESDHRCFFFTIRENGGDRYGLAAETYGLQAVIARVERACRFDQPVMEF